jgi:hypothetical protein
MDPSHPEIERLHALVMSIPSTEVLAHVQCPKPVLYVTAYWGRQHRISLPAHLPSLIPFDPDVETLIQPPTNSPDPASKRGRVKGRKLEAEPFIEMLSIYRYRPQYRMHKT